MAPSRLRQALGAVKDHATISLAKVIGASSNTLSHIEVAVVKATRHGEQPAEEKHVRQILGLTCYSRQHVVACVNLLSRRLSRTKNWTVALKALVLVHRLCLDGDPSYEQEIFFATRRGTRMLNLSDFRDTSHSESWDFSAFVRTFALYLDERLEHRMQGKRDRRRIRSGLDDDYDKPTRAAAAPSPSVRATPVNEMKTDRVFVRIHNLMLLLERFLACRPTGKAKENRIVAMALYPVVKESYQTYNDLVQIMNILIDRFMEMEIPDCVKTHEIFTKIARLFDELEAMYGWCKSVGIPRRSNYPIVERVTQKKLDVMAEFIRHRTTLAWRKQQKGIDADDGDYHDMNGIKALPAPERSTDHERHLSNQEQDQEEREQRESAVKEEEEEEVVVVDLFSHHTKERHESELALALFDGVQTTTSGSICTTKWESFGDDEMDWETALVQSSSNFAIENMTSPGGGLDPFILENLYQQQQPPMHLHGGSAGTGSASSMAYHPVGGSCSMQGFLTLPAPANQEDPFAASLAVAPPPYVQMADMERKQGHLKQEQAMWEQYAGDGMRGQLGMKNLQPNDYHDYYYYYKYHDYYHNNMGGGHQPINQQYKYHY